MYEPYYSRSTILFHARSFKILCNEANRFSAKRLEKLSKVLADNADYLAKLYDEQKDAELYSFIKDKFGEIK